MVNYCKSSQVHGSQSHEHSNPCVRNCCLNEENVCLGCFRTLNEILSWSKMLNEERKSVLKKCHQRHIDLKSRIMKRLDSAD